MLGLPEFGQLVRVWPMPGRQVQDGPRPVDRWAGGAWLPTAGKVVEWSPFHLEQLRCGDLLLHHPPCEKHEHAGEKKDGECASCGRSPDEAAKYDAHAVPARAALAAKAAPAKNADDGKPKLFDRAAATQAHMVAAGLHKEDKPEDAKPAADAQPAPATDAAKKAHAPKGPKASNQNDESER